MRAYPKNRKPRDVSYATTYKILALMGSEELKHLWSTFGMYKTAKLVSTDELPVTPRMINHLAVMNNWKRDVRLVPNIHKAYLAGKIDPGNFQTLDFSHATQQYSGFDPAVKTQNKGH